MNAIEVRNVCKAYQNFQLDHVSLTLPEGTILGLVGENGAGKTTLIRLILDLARKDAGEIQVYGKDDAMSVPSFRNEVGVVLDEVSLPPVMKAAEIGKMMGMIYSAWDQVAYDGLLSGLKIPQDKCFKDFSRGNKMKLGIACALSHHPKLLILDEATSGLDPVVRDELLDILLDFTRDESHAILMSSHIVSDLEKACDYITFLHEGKLLLSEEKDRLREMYGKLICSREDFEKISPEDIIGKRDTGYGMQCIVKRTDVTRGLNLQPVGIEELFVVMVKGDLA